MQTFSLYHKALGECECFIDDIDRHLLKEYKWRLIHSRRGKYYIGASAKIKGKWRILHLHRLIMQPGEGLEVDHINGNSLDNRRENMRVCTHTENARNRKSQSGSFSGIKGVTYNKKTDRYISRIIFNYREIYLGSFKTAEDAAKEYDKAAVIYFGEYAKTNGLGGKCETLQRPLSKFQAI